MATVVTRRNTFYGYPNPQGNQFPDPIVANRAPTQADKAVIGQLWVYPATNSSYILSSINTSGQSVWTVLNIGGAGVFSSLVVNGNITQTAGVTSLLQTTINGSLTQNGGATLLNTDAIAQTVNIGTGAAAKTVSLGSTNTTSTTTINSGSGNINLNGTTVISKAGLVLQTNCTAGGSTSVQSIQLSDDNAGVLYSTLKRYTTGTITAGDRLYLHLINGQQGGADRLAAAIDSFSQTVGAGFVSADIGFTTTNNAGLLARRLVISSEGEVTMPSQPCFNAFLTADIINQTGAAGAPVILFDTISINVGNYYNAATGRFTAPISGNYLLGTSVEVGPVTAAMDKGILYIEIYNAANVLINQLQINTCNPAAIRSFPGTDNNVGFQGQAIIPMVATNYAVIKCVVFNGAGDTVSYLGTTGAGRRCNFYGQLIS